MPVPILPMNAKDDDKRPRNLADPADYDGVDVGLLQGLLRSQNTSQNIKISDSDASLLFKFWKEGKVVEGNTNSVEVPDEFSNNDVLRLKALGFVAGNDTKVVKFTQRAKDVIKTLVLNEENALDSNKVEKPYNEIIAENEKRKSGGIRLALDSKE